MERFLSAAFVFYFSVYSVYAKAEDNQRIKRQAVVSTTLSTSALVSEISSLISSGANLSTILQSIDASDPSALAAVAQVLASLSTTLATTAATAAGLPGIVGSGAATTPATPSISPIVEPQTSEVPTTSDTSTSTSTSTLFTTFFVSAQTEESTTTSNSSHEVPTIYGQCNVVTFSSHDKHTAEILSYVAAGWVIFWALLAILVNLCCGVISVPRTLDFFVEFGVIVFFVFLGFFVLRPNWSGMCRATQIVLHFFIVFILGIIFMEAIIITTLIRGTSTRVHCCSFFVATAFTILVAAGFTCALYFPLHKDYDDNEVQCFVEIYSKLFWTFSIPIGILTFAAVFVNQLGVTACAMARSDVDTDQLYWALRSCRALPILVLAFDSCVFSYMFAIDMQIIWLTGVFLGLCILFGPTLFILHTYVYTRTAKRLYGCCRLCFYRPCPMQQIAFTDQIPLTEAIVEDHVETMEPVPHPTDAAPILTPPAEFEIVNPDAEEATADPLPMPIRAPPKRNPAEPFETSPDDFYDWVTHSDDRKAENVLFRRH